ncbi:hypothetical protein SUDANB121_05448 [Nocardiopsis dassonvillei]|uniref:hypothetical protein n=1 Tax=Nocardiopsis dassonvillei TaxID=2014 RepID=UPI003F5709F6
MDAGPPPQGESGRVPRWAPPPPVPPSAPGPGWSIPPGAGPLPPPPPGSPAAPHRPPARGVSPWLTLVAGLLAGAVVGVGATLLFTSFDLRGRPFDAALDTCGLTDHPSAEVGDEGRSVFLQHRGATDTTGLTDEELDCVLTELDAPDSLFVEMGQTRALDGRRSLEWNGIEATWSFHPDDGLDTHLVAR